MVLVAGIVEATGISKKAGSNANQSELGQSTLPVVNRNLVRGEAS
jgi:hypothetical protein